MEKKTSGKNLPPKVFGLSQFKAEGDTGTFEAVFATLDAIDHDGDTYDPGAIGNQDVVISQWNHGSWGEGAKALPIGVGSIFERGNEAIVSGEFDLDDADAEKTYKKLKYLNGKGRPVEWSFALPEADWRWEDRDGREVRVFTRIEVPEVSPVLLGAGVNTRMTSIKGNDGSLKDFAVILRDELKEAEKLSMAEEDPIVRFEKSVAKALRNTLDSKMGAASDDDVLHGLLPRDKSMQFTKQLDEAVETVERVIARAKEIQNLRNEKGKDLSKAAIRRLKALDDALHDASKEVDVLLTNPNDEFSELAKTIDGGND